MLRLENHFKKIESRINSLPNKLNFKIGEAGNIVGVPNYVLRYWEKEFPSLKPEKFTNKQRIYSKKDIIMLLLIKLLLYEEKFSIEGLRKHLPAYCQQFKRRKKESETASTRIEKKVHQLLHFISQLRSTIESAH